MTRARRIYRRLLRAYPLSWRARFETEMTEAFAEDYARLASCGLTRRARFWMATISQALWFGAAQRLTGGAPLRSILASDWRAAYRSLIASPVVTAAAIVSLTLGIGANTALFSIVNSLMLRQLPVNDPEQLMLLDHGSLTNPIWEQLRQRQPHLAAGMLAYETESFHVSGGGASETVTGAWASGGLFEVLGLRAEFGRLLAEGDDRRSPLEAARVAVVSQAFSRRRFGGAVESVGRTIVVNRVPFTIIGVMPARFTGLDVGVEWNIVVPIAAEAAIEGAESQLDSRSSWWLHVMARRRPGQSVDDATAALRNVQPLIRAATLPPRWGEAEKRQYLSDPFSWVPVATGRSPLRQRFGQALTAVIVVVAIVLLIACVNIANLLLARATGRRHELSVRLALGASRARLARQLLAECLLLSFAGAAAALLVAEWGSALLVAQLSTHADPVFLDLSLDWRVLAFTMAVAVGTALLVGTAPAWRGARFEPIDAMKEESRTFAGDRRFGARQMLIVVQMALSLALVVAAGLFGRSLQSLERVPLGFNPEPLLVAEVTLPPSAAEASVRWAGFRRFRAAALATPGVSGAVLSYLTPISDSGWNAFADVPGGLEVPQRRRLHWVSPIAPGWFDAYGMRLLAGRDFTDGDRLGQPPVMIVNEAFIRRRFGEAAPPASVLGRRVAAGIEGPGPKPSFEIVGVVNDAVYESPRRGQAATMYVPMAQLSNLEASFSLTAHAASPSIVRPLAAALQQVDSQAIVTVRPFGDQIRATMTEERMMALIAGFFGVLAIVMVSVGLYGLASHWVNRRRAEIGIRMALGARPARVVRLVLGQLAWVMAIGIVAGIALSLWAGSFVSALLFGLSPRDPLTIGGAAAVLLAVGILSAWLPARGAARLNPVNVLRA
jgi:predicted permease